MAKAETVYGPKAGTGVTRKQIIRLRKAGLGVTEIARALDMSREGVYWHIRRIDKEEAS